jgi:hypothetical protein
MLGVKAYELDYVAACQKRLAAQLTALDRLTASAGAEGKDGNPLNEVRMLAHSLLHDEGVLASNATIRHRPDRAILGIPVGEPIRMERRGFERLAAAYFDELRTRFT